MIEVAAACITNDAAKSIIHKVMLLSWIVVVLQLDTNLWLKSLMIGGHLIPDTYGAQVHLMYFLFLEDLLDTHRYSWGSAVLASLFRVLDRATNPKQVEIGGCLLLLQSWA